MFLGAAKARRPTARTKIYAFYTRGRPLATPFLCGGSDNAHRCKRRCFAPMDALYLLFSFVLFAVSIGFLLICDRLGRRP